MKKTHNDFLIDAVIAVSNHLKGLEIVLERVLSQDYVTFDLQIGDETYSFHPPSTQEEADLMEYDRKIVVNELIKDALSTLIFRYGGQAIELPAIGTDEWHKAWDRILSFKIPSKQEVASPIDLDSYVEVQMGQTFMTKELDPDGYVHIMEKPGLTDKQRDEKIKELAEKGFKDAA